MTKADQMRVNALHEVGEDYVWGAEGSGDIAGPDDYDCSGFVWAMFNNVGVKYPRSTADGYMHMSKRVDKPTRVGHIGVLLDGNGHAHHIVLYVGRDTVVEARGKAYGVIKTTVNSLYARGCKWYELPKSDLGRLTNVTPVPQVRKWPGMYYNYGDTGNNVRWIQQRLNAHGFKVVVDGEFGPKTMAAVKRFQSTCKLVVDGIVGPKTWARLGR